MERRNSKAGQTLLVAKEMEIIGCNVEPQSDAIKAISALIFTVDNCGGPERRSDCVLMIRRLNSPIAAR